MAEEKKETEDVIKPSKVFITTQSGEKSRKDLIQKKSMAWFEDYKKNHKMSAEFKKHLDETCPPGTKVVDHITGEEYITKGSKK